MSALGPCLLAALLGSTAGHADEGNEASDPAVIRVIVFGDADEMLIQRLIGQTTDLAPRVALSVRPVPPDAPSPDGPSFRAVEDVLEWARGVAADTDARVVLWFSRADDAITVIFADVAEGHLLARHLPSTTDGAETFGESATAEAASLVARMALIGILEGARGETAAETESLEVAPPAPETTSLATPSVPDGRSVDVSLGASAVFDGATRSGHVGPSARVGLTTRRFEFGIRLGASLPSVLDDGRTEVQLSRYAASLFFAYGVRLGARARFVVGIAAGTLVFHRATTVRDPALEATSPSFTPIFFAAPELRAQWFPPLFGGHVGFELELAADVTPVGLTLRYVEAETSVIRTDFRRVQPRIGLSVVIRGGGTPPRE